MTQSAAPQAGAAVPPHQWTVDYGRLSCTLARRLGEEGSAIVALNASLGQDPGELVVMDGGRGLDPRLNGDLAVRLDDGPPLALRARRESRNGRLIAKLGPIPDDFLARVAGARQLSVNKGDDEVLSLAMPNVRGAIDQLARCNDDLLQSWGIDVAARRALRRLPRIPYFGWASDISSTQETFVVFAVEVSETGAPLDCRIVVSTRNPGMDRAICALVRRSAHFEPALDSAGRPVHAQYVNRVHWVVDQ